jgi:NADP-dependent 3-hydroxy acid dehydrogenase YdfG
MTTLRRKSTNTSIINPQPIPNMNSVVTHSSTHPLANRVAVITGASSGIGAATAKALAARGAKVALLARRTALLEKHVAEITVAGGTAIALAVDVTDQRSVDAATKTIATQLGLVNIVINNAGVMLPAPIAEQRTSDWERMIDLNITGAMRVIGAFTPALLEAAKRGSASDLINISSIGAQNVFQNFAVYCATKAAISHLSRNLRTEFGPKNVRVSMFEPGIVVTELADHVTDQGAKDWIFNTRQTIEVLQAEDVAESIAFTVSLPRRVNLQQVTIMPTAQAA